MDEIRSYWKLAAISHYCYLFRDSFKLPDFDDEELELSFLKDINYSIYKTDQSETNSEHLLLKICLILLRGYFKGHIISNENWEQYLIKIFNIQWSNTNKSPSPFLKNKNLQTKSIDLTSQLEENYFKFNELPLYLKVDVIYHLCNYRLLHEDGQRFADNFDSDSLRLEPLGSDSKNYTYWYFHGTRLFRENVNVAKTVETKINSFTNRKSITNNINSDDKTLESDNNNNTNKSSRSKRYKEPQRIGERSSKRQTKPILNLNTSQPIKSNNSTNKVEQFDERVSCGVPLDTLKESWSLVCTNLSDFEAFEEKLNQSKSQPEIKLLTELRKILPIIREEVQLKEKEAKKKLFEFIPRRGSTRLEAKRIHREEQEKEEQVRSELNKRLRAEAEYRAKMEEDRLRLERITKERESRAAQRLKIIEETAVNQSIQNITNDLSSESDQEEDIEIDQMNNGYLYIDSAKEICFTNEHYIGLEKVISSILSNRDAWPFKEPVDEKFAPMYYQVIEKPIDLSIIESRIKRKFYKYSLELEKDLQLMVNNCETFNGPKNGYTLMAYACWRVFKRSMLKYLNYNLLIDEQKGFIYPPPKITNNNPKAAIEARRRKKLKHIKNMKALKILAQAAEMAIKDTNSRTSSSISSPAPSKISSISDNELDEEMDSFKIHSNTLAQYVYTTISSSFSTDNVNSSNNQNDTLTNCDNKNDTTSSNHNHNVNNLNSVLNNDNLTFKSLSEWSETLKESGNSIVLPENSVVVCYAPWLKEHPYLKCEDDEELIAVKVEANVKDDNLPMNNDKIIENVNVEKESQRLVIKLSKCNDSGTAWKPVKFCIGSSILSTNKQEKCQERNDTKFKNNQIISCDPLECLNSINVDNSDTKNNPIKKRLYLHSSSNIISKDDNVNNNEDESFILEQISENDINNVTEDNSSKFEITGCHTDQKSNIQVLRLKRIGNESFIKHDNQ